MEICYIIIQDEHTAILKPQQMNPWDPPSNSESSDADLMIIEAVPPPKKEVGDVKSTKHGAASRHKKQPIRKQDSNSEEDGVIILEDADSISSRYSKTTHS